MVQFSSINNFVFISNISSELKKLLIYFKGTTILTSFHNLYAAGTSGLVLALIGVEFPIKLDLHLNEQELSVVTSPKALLLPLGCSCFFILVQRG